MSDDINMDATSAQLNCETRQLSPPTQKTLIREHEFGSRSLASEAAEEKDTVSTENVNKGSTEASAVECIYNGIEQLRSHQEDLTSNSSCEQLGKQLEEATMNSNSEKLGLLTEHTDGKNLNAKQVMSEINYELAPDSSNTEALVEKQKEDHAQNGRAETGTREIGCLGLEPSELPSEDITKNSSWEQLKPPPGDKRESSLEQLGVPPKDVGVTTSLVQLKPLPDNASKDCDRQFELPLEDAANNPIKSGGGGTRTSTKSTKGKHALRSSAGSTRVLRSRSQEKHKAPEPSNNLPEHGDDPNGEKRRKKKKPNRIKKTPADEFSRVRKHLRYLLHRIKYEQNLIDAYSAEGWKGQSLEKIKPEKELQRAKSEIFRCKLKIRDLFQRLDLSIAEGKLPRSLFDSEGQIDSEDIFCAKCGTKDLRADNDIILCDGACERAFHQFCLEPPLLKQDIPPDDEGWLCPGCDCKVDCIDLLNDSQGTNLSVLDKWERVFPEEAAASAAGKMLDDNLGLPSDDSEDNDYNPDGSEVDVKVEGNESSSDESDFYSASEDIGASPISKQNLEQSSDDSEDDDYDPSAPDLDEQVKEESSSSDFTSDPEDFSVAFDDHRSPLENESVPDEPMCVSSDHTMPDRGSNVEISKVGRRKKQTINDELLSLLETGTDRGEFAPVSGRRHVERLDYKQLYDETYGNVSSDSSDENWVDATDGPKKRRKHYIEMEGSNAEDMDTDQEESEHTPKRRVRKKLDVEGTNSKSSKSYKASLEHGSSGSSAKRSTYRRLGEAATQGLLISFKENQYPERAMKENLAKELGITVHQVSKWFENARWSFRHSAHMKALVENAPSRGTPPQTNPSVPGPKMVTEDVHNEESSKRRYTSPRARKKSCQSEHQAPYHVLGNEETQKLNAPVDLQNTEEVLEKGRPKKAQEKQRRGRPKSRKSAA
ncbi:Pathogenesis-related homeodomain protein [Actinidia chinensis var. chinensis]|uniref:Pathogenesis-related homeodomain protein n=1 Tax=Actinidia chinensis var. chinensis TaxID=1590841 RepID=A0A2R6RGY4_ACTCC|nr:Pathogenesis-related homeodomain protein [Actinidia chinensis var. chinensis]